MQRGVSVVRPETDAQEALELLDDENIGGVPVVTREGRLAGIVSKTDLVRAMAEERAIAPGQRAGKLTVRVRDVMTRDVVTANEDETAGEVATRMLDHNIHRVVVVRRGEIVGIVSSMDLLGALAEYETSLGASH